MSQAWWNAFSAFFIIVLMWQWWKRGKRIVTLERFILKALQDENRTPKEKPE